MSTPVTVYVKLMNEDVNVWRPVTAEQLEGDRYRLVGSPPEGEVWPFTRNDVVRCERRQLSGPFGHSNDVLVACEKTN